MVFGVCVFASCSICAKKGIVHLIVPPEQFTLTAGNEETDMTSYTFNTRQAKHLFCKICGMHPFYHPRSHPGAYDINLRCLDTPSDMSKFQVSTFDGQNWEANIHKIASDAVVVERAHQVQLQQAQQAHQSHSASSSSST